MKKYVEDIRKEVKVKQDSSPAIVMFVPLRHDPKRHRTLRPGKTTKDKKREVKKNNVDNKQARESWMKDPRRTAKTFPLHTCNGKASKPLRRG